MNDFPSGVNPVKTAAPKPLTCRLLWPSSPAVQSRARLSLRLGSYCFTVARRPRRRLSARGLELTSDSFLSDVANLACSYRGSRCRSSCPSGLVGETEDPFGVVFIDPRLSCLTQLPDPIARSAPAAATNFESGLRRRRRSYRSFQHVTHGRAAAAGLGIQSFTAPDTCGSPLAVAIHCRRGYTRCHSPLFEAGSSAGRACSATFHRFTSVKPDARPPSRR